MADLSESQLILFPISALNGKGETDESTGGTNFAGCVGRNHHYFRSERMYG